MTRVYGLIGAIAAGLAVAVFSGASGFVLVVMGAVIGVLFAQTRALRTRLANLESMQPVSATQRSASTDAPAAPSTFSMPVHAEPMDRVVPVPVTPRAPTPTSADPIVVPREPSAPLAVTRPAITQSIVTPLAVTPPAATTQAVPPRAAERATRSAVRPVDPVEAAVSGVRRWFTQGNVPVKVGVVVLFLGVAALLKYAADSGWLRMPIQFRLAGVAVAAIAALVFAWQKRTSHRPFALSLQGGAIGILILDVFVAYRLYGLLPAGLAFAVLVVIVGGGAVLAVLQDAVALAVLAIAGGFLAPILVSTGDGNHVVLFTYYALLNATIFGIAWIRPWRALNLLGFAFTFGIGIAWGVTRYRPEQFASTEPFLVLFFLFYLALPVLYALRRRAEQPTDRRDFVDGTLLFGTPLVAFASQVGLLEAARLPLASSALAVATLYTLLATVELRRWKLVLLGQSHAVLALGFATLAVPLALSARSTSCTWALEGTALVWLGLRQQRQVPKVIGYGLQAAAVAAFLLVSFPERSAVALLNGPFANALLIALAGLITARLVDRLETRAAERSIAHGFFLWGWAWSWLAFGEEIQRFAPPEHRADLTLVLCAATALVAGEVLRRWKWDDCAWPVYAMFPLAGIVFAAVTSGSAGPVDHGLLERGSAAAWAFWFVCALRSLDTLRTRDAVRVVHVIFLWLIVLVVGSEVVHVLGVHLRLGAVWLAFGAMMTAAAMLALVLQRQALVRWPLGDAAEVSRRGLLTSLIAAIGCGWIAGLFAAGDPVPLPYVPLLNPLELGQVAVLVLLLKWFNQAVREGHALVDAELRARALAVAGFAVLTIVTLRSAHFLGGVPWGAELWDSPLAQAALSITWTLAGIFAMLLGQRRGSRAVWFGGAVLMGVVVAKLGLVDRRFLHDLQAIVGVLVVGLLLVVVGYFAPAPPKPVVRGAAA